jgi:nicotinamide riboside kinase
MKRINRIAVVGPESSGKTTLSKALSKSLGWIMIEEFAREYFESHDYRSCSLEDLIEISKVQFQRTHAFKLNEAVISDTEIITIEIWAKDKFLKVPKEIKELRKKQKFDLYVLSFPDMPWQDDKLRSDSQRREIIYSLYLNFLQNNNLPFVEVRGGYNSRVEQIIEYITLNSK